jgi:hypothetical protein
MIMQYFRSIVVASSLLFISGCVGYAQPQGYSSYSTQVAMPYSTVMPYGGYNGGYNLGGMGREVRNYGPYRSNEREVGRGGYGGVGVAHGGNEVHGNMRGEHEERGR